ncbi:MAG TPA: family 1 glycosylhydrolase, partial [Acidimicrobiales bacterium]|nr:family 1 glycosylhydrolase [Acidimicrobiales bacterium]
MSRQSWPSEFMWGTGASSTQCEGAAPASDWWQWERNGKAPVSGDGNGFALRFAEDFGLLAGLGLTHHRLSLEWARLEPTEGVHDEMAVDHYRQVLGAARAAGVTPWVCLHHFTLPGWFAAAGGFLLEANRTSQWARHVDWVAETFGDLVGGWQPVNETNYYAAAAYLGGRWPPGHRDRTEWALASENIQLATAEAAVRLRQTGAPVASIFGLSCEVPLDDTPATDDRVRRLREVNWEAGIGLFRDGLLRTPGRPPVERADLAGCFDLLGFSYY